MPDIADLLASTKLASSPPIAYGTKEHPYSTLPETKEDLAWADLVTLDLSRFDAPGGKQELAEKLRKGVHEVGFFYITNFGFDQAEVDQQFAIGKEVFDLPDEEKERFAADHEHGGYNGYTGPNLRWFKEQKIERRQNVEVYNLPKFTPDFDHEHASHPKPVVDNWAAITRFGKEIHTKVIEKLLVVFALVLELEDEQYFVKRHLYDAKSEDHLRYMKYKARSAEDNEKANNLYSGGHTDLGSVTLLFRQPVSALQVLGGDGTWKWVKPVEGSITVNIADTLQILSGEYLKSSVHRVVVPPKDQVQYDRIGVLYFVRPNNQVLVEAVKNSPVLSEEGVYERIKEQQEKGEIAKEPITVETWVQERQKHIFSKAQQARYTQLIERGAEGKEKKDLTTTVAGIKVKYYN